MTSRGGRRRGGDVEITRLGRYELHVHRLHAGTRSEGRVGRLYLDGREVPGSRPGERIETEPGGAVVVFVGDDRPHLWSTSGWSVETADRH